MATVLRFITCTLVRIGFGSSTSRFYNPHNLKCGRVDNLTRAADRLGFCTRFLDKKDMFISNTKIFIYIIKCNSFLNFTGRGPKISQPQQPLLRQLQNQLSQVIVNAFRSPIVFRLSIGINHFHHHSPPFQ